MGLESGKRRERSPSTEKEPVIERSYALESGISVELRSRIYENHEGAPDEAFVFLPGWSMDVDTDLIDPISRAFADESGASAHVITTRATERGIPGADDTPDVLYEEARAIAKYIQERGIRTVTLAGHSQGGMKAVDLAVILQSDPELTVRGTIMLDAVGIYEQSPQELARKFTHNALIGTPAEILRSAKKQSLRTAAAAIPSALGVGNRVMGNVAKEVMRSGSEWWPRFQSEVEEMSRFNLHMHELRSPVVIVSGLNDTVSDPQRIFSKILPADKRDKLLSRVAKEGETPVALEREAYLKSVIFPHSPYVRMLQPEKLGAHVLPFLRPDSIAAASVYLLNRYERSKK